MITRTILFILLFFILYKLYPIAKKAISTYFLEKKYWLIQKEIDEFFADINPYQISMQARQHGGLSQPDLVYGEILPITLLRILEKIRPQPQAILYDLGSGCGKTLLTAKLQYPEVKMKGIELLSDLHQIAQQKLQAYRASKHLDPTQFDIEYTCGNFLIQDFTDADIILTNSVAFSLELWLALVAKLEKLKCGAKIITSTHKPLPLQCFALQYRGMEPMSWGLATLYIYEKIV